MRSRGTTVVLLAAAVLAVRLTAFAQPIPPGITEDAIKNAKTPEQHQAIADAYAKEAANLKVMADAHRRMNRYYSEPGYLEYAFPTHCEALSQDLEAAAKELDMLAKNHHAMAEAAANKTK